MNLLAFDLGKRMGVAGRCNGEIRSWWENNNNTYDAYKQICLWIEEIKPAAVLYENAAFQAGWAGQDWQQWRVACEMACQKYSIACSGVAVGTIKKHITGCGRCPKPKKKTDPEYGIFTALRARGYDIKDHNEADALAVLLYAIDTNLVEVE